MNLFERAIFIKSGITKLTCYFLTLVTPSLHCYCFFLVFMLVGFYFTLSFVAFFNMLGDATNGSNVFMSFFILFFILF